MSDTSLIFNIIAKDKTSATFDKIKGGAAAAGVAIGAVLVAGVQQAMEKSRLDNTLAMQLGATPDQAAQLGKLSGEVYAAGFGEDLPGVNDAIRAAVQNGLVDVKNLSSEAAQSATQSLLTVGRTLEEDSSRVSSAVSQMLRTGMAGSAQEAMDLLVAATQKGVNKSGDLLDTVNEYGTQFRKLGLDGPQAMGLLSQAIQAGARDSDTAADALKEFSIRAIDGSKAASEGYKALGLDAAAMTAQIAKGGPDASAGLNTVLTKLKEMKDPVAQNAAAVGLFGTKAEDLGQALFAMDLGSAANQMGQVAGATDKASATAQSGMASYEQLGRQFQMALVDTLNLALPAVNAVFGFMSRNSAWVQPLAVALGVLAIALGVVVAVTWAWNAALALNPVTWIIVGIVALIAIIVVVATKTKFFQTIWGAVWGFFKAIGSWFAGPFANFFVNTWNKLVSGFNTLKNKVGEHIGAVKRSLTSFKDGAVSAFNKVVDKGASLINWFRNAPGKVRSSLSNMFSPLWSGFKGAINKVIGGWNGLSFTVGGGSFMGVNIPSTTISTPNIPYLKVGTSMVKQDGLAFLHRGESVTPAARVTQYKPHLDKGRDKPTGKLTPRPRWASSPGGGDGHTITIRGDGSRVAALLLELMREAIRSKGGDPVRVLTPL